MFYTLLNKLNKLEEKTYYLLYLLSRTEGLINKTKISVFLLMNLIFPNLFRNSPCVTEIKLKEFYFQFRIGQGELTPYFQILKARRKQAFPFPQQSWTVIDCGANTGLFSLFFKSVKQIIAVEINKDCCDRIKHNFQRNHIQGTIINKAISYEEGEVKITINDNTTVLSSIDRKNGNLIIQSTTIDSIVEEYNLTAIDLLKLDIEEYEIEALKGAKRSLDKSIIKRIYAEFNNRQSLQDIDNLLSKYNFKKTQVFEHDVLYEL